MTGRLLLIRVVVTLTALLGVNYIAWRWVFSVHWQVWWIAVPLVLAETYSLIDSLLFGLTVWRLRPRPEPPPPPENATVDVLITTYNEDNDLVMETARAALRISYPHRTWILDDGSRPGLRQEAEAAGVGWIARSADWAGRPRHAKAGNLNNALLATDGEFLLILDADQVPMPQILDRTLGYFRDERMAVVQTPQLFVNVPPSDPLGSQAPLFYGPLQQGKDGWNAAFFCGSNAVIRREALMRLGVSRYVRAVEDSVFRALRTADAVLAKAGRELGPGQDRLGAAIAQVRAEVAQARAEIRRSGGLADVTYRFQRRAEAVVRRIVEEDVAGMTADLLAIRELADGGDGGDGGDGADGGPGTPATNAVLRQLTRRDWSPLGAIESVHALLRAIDIDRSDEAQPLMPMATISVTEDMATCMRLHAMGWKSAYHHELLAHGLAPEDLGTMLTQRLRWAQGTMQVMFRENPLLQRGLTLPQRLMYLATIWSYLSGFAAVVYLAAPVIYLSAGILPVKALSAAFFLRLVPFLVANQLLFLIVGHGTKTWRGQQYSLALFPVWIKAVTSAFNNVYRGRSLAFAVTPKTRQDQARPAWHLVKYQLAAAAMLIAAVVAGIIRAITGHAAIEATVINVIWVVYDLLILSVIIPAARYGGFQPAKDR
jgi:cellulose synthase (UDP-forming)